jgi:hypothetical protein
VYRMGLATEFYEDVDVLPIIVTYRHRYYWISKATHKYMHINAYSQGYYNDRLTRFIHISRGGGDICIRINV